MASPAAGRAGYASREVVPTFQEDTMKIRTNVRSGMDDWESPVV